MSADSDFRRTKRGGRVCLLSRSYGRDPAGRSLAEAAQEGIGGRPETGDVVVAGRRLQAERLVHGSQAIRESRAGVDVVVVVRADDGDGGRGTDDVRER